MAGRSSARWNLLDVMKFDVRLSIANVRQEELGKKTVRGFPLPSYVRS